MIFPAPQALGRAAQFPGRAFRGLYVVAEVRPQPNCLGPYGNQLGSQIPHWLPMQKGDGRWRPEAAVLEHVFGEPVGDNTD